MYQKTNHAVRDELTSSSSEEGSKRNKFTAKPYLNGFIRGYGDVGENEESSSDVVEKDKKGSPDKEANIIYGQSRNSKLEPKFSTATLVNGDLTTDNEAVSEEIEQETPNPEQANKNENSKEEEKEKTIPNPNQKDENENTEEEEKEGIEDYFQQCIFLKNSACNYSPHTAHCLLLDKSSTLIIISQVLI